MSLLAERPMHGYQINQELESRDVRDWADISRPQVYYSVKKLHERKMIKLAKDSEKAGGPERQLYEPTSSGIELLKRGLADPSWALKRDRPPFLTWLALSSHADRKDRKGVIQKRREFLRQEMLREEATLKEIKNMADEGNMLPEAELMVSLTIAQFQTELDWLDKVEKKLAK